MVCCGLLDFFPALVQQFGWRYVALIVLVYGINQLRPPAIF